MDAVLYRGSPVVADGIDDGAGCGAAGSGSRPRRLVSREPVSMPRWIRDAGLAFLVLCPAAVLRTVELTALGYNSDEAVYAGQGLSLAGQADYLPYFPVFRAHPLLFQATLSVVFGMGGFSELAGRLVSVGFGLATVGAVYVLGRVVYSPRVGYLAALIVAVMPYLVVVNRQVLLDGPMTFFATLTLCLLAQFARSGRAGWLYAAAMAMGLAVLTKETAVLLLSGVYAFFALVPAVRWRWRDMIGAGTVFVAMVAIYPVTVSASGASRTGGNFVVWQLLRRANHSWTFYPSVVPPAIGLPVVAAALAGLWFLRGHRTWREMLLGLWVVGPAVFFEAWAVKGYQYLLPIVGPVAVLAARAIVAAADVDLRKGRIAVDGRMVSIIACVATVGTLSVQSWNVVLPDRSRTTFVAGQGGIPGGREAGTWIAHNVPDNARFLAVGPSMANLIQFYGHRKAYGISVSPNPLHRNPVYEPVHNPDAMIRRGDLQYLVWDSFSAARSPFFAERLMQFVGKYHGTAVHTESLAVRRDGRTVLQPIIIVYVVRS